MKLTLIPPDFALAQSILMPVGYKDRFPAGRLRPPVGILPGTVGSLHELHLLLEPDDRSLPGVNPERLIGWIAETVGDTALAERLRQEQQSGASYVDWCLLAYELVGERLTQASVVTGKEKPV